MWFLIDVVRGCRVGRGAPERRLFSSVGVSLGMAAEFGGFVFSELISKWRGIYVRCGIDRSACTLIGGENAFIPTSYLFSEFWAKFSMGKQHCLRILRYII